MADELTVRQEGFSQSIAIKEFKYSWLAYQAHYSTDKMSMNNIYSETCRLLQNPKVSLRIEKLKEQIATKSQTTLEDILKDMTDRLKINSKDYFGSDGKVKNIQDLTDNEARFIDEFKVDPNGMLKEVKLISLKSLWDMFMKKFGAYITTSNIKIKGEIINKSFVYSSENGALTVRKDLKKAN